MYFLHCSSKRQKKSSKAIEMTNPSVQEIYEKKASFDVQFDQLAELWPSPGGRWYEEGLSRGRGTGAPGKGSRGGFSILINFNSIPQKRNCW